jgi:hypothetical protein
MFGDFQVHQPFWHSALEGVCLGYKTSVHHPFRLLADCLWKMAARIREENDELIFLPGFICIRQGSQQWTAIKARKRPICLSRTRT